MDSKPWYTSKTVWSGIVTALVAAAQAICLQFGIDLMANSWAQMVLGILGAIGIYGRVSANTVIK